MCSTSSPAQSDAAFCTTPTPLAPSSAYQNNVVGKAQANVAFHYDLSRNLFELFLDRDHCNIRVLISQIRAATAWSRAQLNKKEARCHRKAAARARRACARYRIPVLAAWRCIRRTAPRCRRPWPSHPVGGTVARFSGSRQKAAGLEKKVTFKLLDYREGKRALRSRCLRRHVRACRRQPPTMRLLPQTG